MKKLSLYVLILITCVQCQKENEDCHFFITLNNNSSKNEISYKFFEVNIPTKEIEFESLYDFIKNEDCKRNNSQEIKFEFNLKFRPFEYPTYKLNWCIEDIMKINNEITLLIILYDCKDENIILRTYILTLEDLERLNYTINYPEDVSIGVD